MGLFLGLREVESRIEGMIVVSIEVVGVGVVDGVRVVVSQQRWVP